MEKIKKNLRKIISLAWQDANDDIVRLAQSILSIITDIEKKDNEYLHEKTANKASSINDNRFKGGN